MIASLEIRFCCEQCFILCGKSMRTRNVRVCQQVIDENKLNILHEQMLIEYHILDIQKKRVRVCAKHSTAFQFAESLKSGGNKTCIPKSNRLEHIHFLKRFPNVMKWSPVFSVVLFWKGKLLSFRITTAQPKQNTIQQNTKSMESFSILKGILIKSNNGNQFLGVRRNSNASSRYDNHWSEANGERGERCVHVSTVHWTQPWSPRAYGLRTIIVFIFP